MKHLNNYISEALIKNHIHINTDPKVLAEKIFASMNNADELRKVGAYMVDNDEAYQEYSAPQPTLNYMYAYPLIKKDFTKVIWLYTSGSNITKGAKRNKWTYEVVDDPQQIQRLLYDIQKYYKLEGNIWVKK